MNATPSRFGVWTDITAASVLAGALLVCGLFVVRRLSDSRSLYVALALAAAPLIVSGGFSIAIRGSREVVVSWLASLPFPIENLNALLAGVSDGIEIIFEPGTDLPSRAVLQPKLEEVSDDLLLVKERPEEQLLEVRLGVIDSKRMPLRTNHQRWKRLLDVVERVLVPLSKTLPIRQVRIA